MRILNALMLLAFLLSAAVQLNDPDPLPWIAIYLAAALACLAWARGHRGLALPVSIGLIALVWSTWLVLAVPADTAVGPALQHWQMADQGSELVREVGGLWLVVAWMAIVCARRRHTPTATG